MTAQEKLIEAWLEAGRTTDDGERMSSERLKAVFDLVKDSEHWKNPIDARVPEDVATASEIQRAVAWYCGGEPDVVTCDGEHHVTGAGYWGWGMDG